MEVSGLYCNYCNGTLVYLNNVLFYLLPHLTLTYDKRSVVAICKIIIWQGGKSEHSDWFFWVGILPYGQFLWKWS